MRRRTKLSGLAAYLAIGLLTFGYAASNSARVERDRYEKCRADLAEIRASYLCRQNHARPPIGGAYAGALWPLYWTWEAFS